MRQLIRMIETSKGADGSEGVAVVAIWLEGLAGIHGVFGIVPRGGIRAWKLLERDDVPARARRRAVTTLLIGWSSQHGGKREPTGRD